ncbi:unnamed protein product [Didymodactylos carnosus]|uniref:Uncharacterized protein n=1 Tax=Didymodactylos carnosus TaxID=1234261 RepID=A0A814JXY0_9BILA|nr:unnamed protein product [Didymodactylos carnosus]CAF1043989.1 unnamed protein product [Didymodactylos carnosus]CAF3668737.1 unnamed protein product [Didymodactylos carnosus]CAF3814011.1 unnamed protein product [Didymodactylos carnosus]
MHSFSFLLPGTIAPLNRLRTIFAFVAAVALFVFGVLAAVEANRLWSEYPTYHDHRNAVIAAVIAFVGMIIYILEAVARNRKSRIV